MAEDKASAKPQATPESLEPVDPAEELQKFLFYGDLSSLSKSQQNEYVFKLSKSMGLNPWTRPFDMIVLNGKLTVYTNKGAAAQLRDLKHINLKKVYAGALRMGEGMPCNPAIYEVEIEASIPDEKAEGGFRRSCNVGTVPIENLVGEALSNAVLKCWTKAERRATLAIAGIAFPDETEVGSIPTGPSEPQRRLPRQLSAVQKAPEPLQGVPSGGYDQPTPTTTTTVGGEKVDTKTGEIITEAEVVEKQLPPPPSTPVNATPSQSLPSRGKFPPAVAPASMK